jgi:hypothetical protein
VARDWQAVLQAFIDCACPLKAYYIRPATVKFWRFMALRTAAEALLAALEAYAAAALAPAPAAEEAAAAEPAAVGPAAGTAQLAAVAPPATDPAVELTTADPAAAAVEAPAAATLAVGNKPPPGLTVPDVVRIVRLDYTENRVFRTSGPCLPPTATWQPHPMVLTVRECCRRSDKCLVATLLTHAQWATSPVLWLVNALLGRQLWPAATLQVFDESSACTLVAELGHQPLLLCCDRRRAPLCLRLLTR